MKTTDQSLWYFENVNLFKILCPHKIKDLGEKHEFHHFQKNEFIYFPNEHARYIYMISNGRVKIGSYTDDGKEIIKSILGPGEIFGEMVLIGEETRTDFAMALDKDTTICIVSLEDMIEMMAENKDFSLKVYKIIGLRMRKLERKIESLVFKDARTRIIEFLHEVASWKGQKVGFETMIKTKLTHKDIGDLTGTSRQTVTTVLNELKDKNLINFNRKQILIRDLAKLA
jgi:CRP/FNR family transcriptional regulator, cyclic AMP receptor protein